jgi:hypothetical protein
MLLRRRAGTIVALGTKPIGARGSTQALRLGSGYDASVTFELRGNDTDEARQVLHRDAGFSSWIPGHPRLSTMRSDHFGLRLADADVTVEYRLDDLPRTGDARALAMALIEAYMTNAAKEPVRFGPAPVPTGADTAASATYALDGDDEHAMEFTTIALRNDDLATHALYQIVRFRRGELNPVQWANFRTAVAHAQDWSANPSESPTLWPNSSFAAPGIGLELLPAALDEANAKAVALREISSNDIDALTDILIEFAVSNDPPSYELQHVVLDMGARQIAMRCESRFAEILLRNFYSIRSTHDLRGWCWQCLWALGNRAL